MSSGGGGSKAINRVLWEHRTFGGTGGDQRVLPSKLRMETPGMRKFHPRHQQLIFCAPPACITIINISNVFEDLVLTCPNIFRRPKPHNFLSDNRTSLLRLWRGCPRARTSSSNDQSPRLLPKDARTILCVVQLEWRLCRVNLTQRIYSKA